MVRKYFCNDTPKFHAKQVKILFYIASKNEGEIITITDVAHALNEKISTLHHHFTKLRDMGLIDKQNILTTKGKKVLRFFKHWDKTFERKLRAHKIQVTLFLVKLPKNFFEIKNTVLTPFTNNKYSGLKAELMGCPVMFYGSKKAVAVIPDILANNDEEIAAAITDFLPQLKEALELEFPGLKIDGHKVGKFSSMHIAILHSIIAETFMLKNQRCQSNGRVAIDASHGKYELEAEKGSTALEDIEVLVKYEDMALEVRRLTKEVESLKNVKEVK